jgi:hypothetical protein
VNFRGHRFILEVIEELKSMGADGQDSYYQNPISVKSFERIAVPYAFVLYQHGPFSFEVGDELALMRLYARGRRCLVPGYDRVFHLEATPIS